MTETLSDGTRTISLFPEWSSDRNDELVMESSRSIGGRESAFIWGKIGKFNFGLEYLTSSDAALLNEWWMGQTDLFLFFDAASYDVRIVNTEQPIQSLNQPYRDHWSGTISMEVI